MNENKPEVIVCACHHTDHSIIYNKWEDKKHGNEVFLSFCMSVEGNFWKRLANFWRYVIKKERFGSHGEICINESNIDGFKDIVNFIQPKTDVKKHWELMKSFNKINR